MEIENFSSLFRCFLQRYILQTLFSFSHDASAKRPTFGALVKSYFIEASEKKFPTILRGFSDRKNLNLTHTDDSLS